MRNQRNADVVNRGNADVVRGHINVELVNRHNVEVVNQGAKQRARKMDNVIQENVQQDKFVLDKHLAVSVKKGKVHRVNKYA